MKRKSNQTSDNQALQAVETPFTLYVSGNAFNHIYFSFRILKIRRKYF